MSSGLAYCYMASLATAWFSVGQWWPLPSNGETSLERAESEVQCCQPPPRRLRSDMPASYGSYRPQTAGRLHGLLLVEVCVAVRYGCCLPGPSGA